MEKVFFSLIDEIAKDDENIRQDVRNTESNPSDYKSWNKLAARLLQEEYYAQAIDCYDKAIELNPNNIDSWYNRGLALNNLSRYEEAILCYDKVIKIDPKHVYAWNSKGYALNYMGKFQEAIKSYDRVLEIDENNVTAWYNRGLALTNIGKYEEAIKSYDRVLEIDENNADALYNKANLLIAIGKYDAAAAGKYDAAARLLNRILAANPNEIRALDSLRQLYSNYTFEFDKALSTATKLFKIQPTPETKTMLAEDFIKSGKYKKGRELAIEAKSETPENKIKRQCTIRLLILLSYFLEDNIIKGKKQLFDFLNYYRELEYFEIDENEWNFNGLIKAINVNSSNSITKLILTDLIELLRAKRGRDKILARLATNISNLQIIELTASVMN